MESVLFEVIMIKLPVWPVINKSSVLLSNRLLTSTAYCVYSYCRSVCMHVFYMVSRPNLSFLSGLNEADWSSDVLVN